MAQGRFKNIIEEIEEMNVSVTKLCSTPHPTEKEVSCGRPQGHPGWHLSTDHKHNWQGADGTAAAATTAICGSRHPTGRTCALPQGHRGGHCTSDHLLQWAVLGPGR